MAIPPEAARTTFDGANDLFVEDGSLGLKYVLQRLELVGLTEQDRQNPSGFGGGRMSGPGCCWAGGARPNSAIGGTPGGGDRGHRRTYPR